MQILLLIFFLLTALIFPRNALASFEKINYPNNKFGIHLALPSEEDLASAHQLVNSSGGDWGYVTLVMEEKDRNQQKWQTVFDKMRTLHLIPIIRLATSFEGQNWRKPEAKDANDWADFLNSLNWVVKNRYLVLFNEPNHSAEWGGSVSPQDYGQTALAFAKALKEKNADFFIMLAGFDAAAPSQPPKYEDEEKFLRKMAVPGIFDDLDGWTSHSYPNYGFVGSPFASGRNSVRNYQWELNLLKSLGVKKNLPVFITETGWPHQEGINFKKNFYSAQRVATYFQSYFSNIIADSRVIAVTPFILNYQGEPFDSFSWQKLNSKEFYPQYQAIQQMIKLQGEPIQEQKLSLLENLPTKLIKNSTYQISLKIKNEGQAIWDTTDNYQIVLEKTPPGFAYFLAEFSPLFPFEERTLWLYLKTGDQLGQFEIPLGMAKNGKTVTNQISWQLEIVPQIKIGIKVSLLLKRKTEGDDFKFLIYNNKEEVIFVANNVQIKNGAGEIANINNLVIGEKYRLVILKPYYLPRQGFLTVSDNKNEITFQPMLPLDFDLDGKFTFNDIVQFFRLAVARINDSLLWKPKNLFY